MSTTEEIESMDRNTRLVTEALYHLTQLKKLGFVEGGNVAMTPAGEEIGAAIAAREEFTQDELNAAALIVMNETGGIQREEA